MYSWITHQNRLNLSKSLNFIVQVQFQKAKVLNRNDPLIFTVVPLKCRHACLCKKLFLYFVLLFRLVFWSDSLDDTEVPQV